MIKWIFTIIILSLFLTAIMATKIQDHHPTQAEQLVNSTLAKAAKIIKKKYRINPCGEGAAMPGGPIQELILCFETKDQLSKEALRKLLILTAQELLNQVIENDEIQQFLKDRPFTVKNIQITIYNHDKYGRTLYDPYFLTAEISGGILTYRTVEPKDDIFKLKNEFKESYEDAVNALKIQE